MALSCAVFVVWGAMRPAGTRVFHYLSAALLATASVAYFSMASNLGATATAVEYVRGGTLGANWVSSGVMDPTRAIWYARYIDWTITTPLLLLELLLGSGLPLADVFSTIFFDLVMIITGLIGALVVSDYKWGYFAFGCAALVYIWYILLGPARKSALALGPEYHGSYMRSAIFLSVIWMIYPIIWGIADGGNVIKPDSEMIAYGILDLIAKPVFCFIHCIEIGKLDMSRYTFNNGLPGGAAPGVGGATYEKGVGNNVRAGGRGPGAHVGPTAQTNMGTTNGAATTTGI